MYWHTQGVAKEKLVIGLATYGRTFTLANSANYNIGDPVTGAGNAGPYTGEAGFLAYYEVTNIHTLEMEFVVCYFQKLIDSQYIYKFLLYCHYSLLGNLT